MNVILKSLSFMFIDMVQSELLEISYNIYIKQGRVEGTDFSLTYSKRLEGLLSNDNEQ